MSGGNVCSCAESKKPITDRNWLIVHYKCNYSAFNGGKKTNSDYSLIHCPGCGCFWRTKSKYVLKLKFFRHETGKR